MPDIDNLKDDLYFKDDYPVIYKTQDDIIADINFKNPEDEAITRAIINVVEDNISKHLKAGKAVALPYVGVLQKNLVHMAMKNHAAEMKFAKRTMVKEDYAQYAYDLYGFEMRKVEREKKADRAYKKLRKYNNKKYFTLLNTHGKIYADAYIFSIQACDVVDFDPEVQEKFDELYNVTRKWSD